MTPTSPGRARPPADTRGAVGRAGAFALVGTLALAGPALEGTAAAALAPATLAPLAAAAPAAPFVLVALFSLWGGAEGRLFELFARPGDRRDGRLYGLAGFSLAAAGLALLASVFGMPHYVFVASVLVLSYGNLAARAAGRTTPRPIVVTAGFAAGGLLAGLAGGVLVVGPGAPRLAERLPELVFLAASGAFLGALLRSVLFERDDPLVMVSIGLVLWLFADLPVRVTASRVAVALAVPAVLGYLSYALETASIPGMLTGTLLGFLTIALGGYDWFAVLIAFFAIGGLSAKFRYEEKVERGVAESNEGARGSGNVLANSAVALLAVVGFAASPRLGVSPETFLFAFAGSLAAALSDTLSSEIGGLFDGPRLITTFESVPPGTDGGVTWQGELVGLAGAAVVAAVAAFLFRPVGPAGVAVIVTAGVAGMTIDSVLGATVEGAWFGNEGVNLVATLSAAVIGAGLAVGAGLTPLWA